MRRRDHAESVRGTATRTLTCHGSINPADIRQQGYLSEFVRKFRIILELVAGHLRAAGRVQERIDVEITKGDLGTSRIAMKSGVWVGKHCLRVGEEVVKEVVL